MVKIRGRLAMLLAVGVLSAGCTGNVRNRDRGLRDPVQLPAAPKLEQGPVGATAPNAGGPLISPLSATAPGSMKATR
jgi:hypothetical protein